MGTFKDTITNICGIIVAIGGSLLTAHFAGQIILPPFVVTILGILVTISTALIGYFNGKDKDGKAKKE